MHWVDPRRYFPDFCRPNLYGMRCQPIAADFFRRARYRRHNRSAVTMRQWTRRKQKPSLFAWIPLFSTRISASSPIRMSLASSGTSANRRPDIVPQGFNHSAEAFQSKPLQSALFRRTVTDLYPTGNLPVLPYRSDFSLEGRRSIRASGGSPRGAADAPVLARGGSRPAARTAPSDARSWPGRMKCHARRCMSSQVVGSTPGLGAAPPGVHRVVVFEFDRGNAAGLDHAGSDAPVRSGRGPFFRPLPSTRPERARWHQRR